MSTSILKGFRDDSIVFHYGVLGQSIDAYTVSRSTIFLVDALREVGSILEQDSSVRFEIDAVGPGSFRLRLTKVSSKFAQNILPRPKDIVAGVFVAFLASRIWQPDPNVEVRVEGDLVKITTNEDTYIIPTSVFEGLSNVQDSERVRNRVRQTFDLFERDETVQNFGVTSSMLDLEPRFLIQREKFSVFGSRTKVDNGDIPERRQVRDARLLIRKSWLESGTHKWAFDWDGVPISAAIADLQFLDDVESRRILFGHGDFLDVQIEFSQRYDSDLGIWCNLENTFRVTEVRNHVPRRSERLL